MLALIHFLEHWFLDVPDWCTAVRRLLVTCLAGGLLLFALAVTGAPNWLSLIAYWALMLGSAYFFGGRLVNQRRRG
jgi:hypothetical protein